MSFVVRCSYDKTQLITSCQHKFFSDLMNNPVSLWVMSTCSGAASALWGVKLNCCGRSSSTWAANWCRLFRTIHILMFKKTQFPLLNLKAMVSESAGGARVSPQESMRSNYKPAIPGQKSSTLPAHTLSSASTGSAKRAWRGADVTSKWPQSDLKVTFRWPRSDLEVIQVWPWSDLQWLWSDLQWPWSDL